MPRFSLSAGGFALAIVALACWAVMFLAGHDVWHDLGRPDLWTRGGAPYVDGRAFVIAYYALLPIVLIELLLSMLIVRRRGSDGPV